MRGQGPRWPVWGKMALAGWGPQTAPKQHCVPKQEDRGPVARGSLCAWQQQSPLPTEQQPQPQGQEE